MPWSAPLSIPLSAEAGKWVGDRVKEKLKDEHWLVQHLASAAAEAATTYVVGGGINLLLADVPSAVTVTPAQAAAQGIARAITGESVADKILNIVLQGGGALLGHEAIPAVSGPDLGHITRHPGLFLPFEKK